jgi:hypothetical protein
MVSLVAFLITAYGMNPYVVATFSSTLACEGAKAAILSAALKETNRETTTYAIAPRKMTCIATPGIVAGGSSRPPDTGTPLRAPPKPATAPSNTSKPAPAPTPPANASTSTKKLQTAR